MEIIDNLPDQGNVLLLTNGCGHGHISCSKMISSEIKTHKTALRVFEREYHTSVWGRLIGEVAIRIWSSQQDHQDITALNRHLKFQWVEEWILYPWIFLYFVTCIFWNNVDTIITVQPLGLKGMIHAARFVNFIRWLIGNKRKPIKIQMVLTELPTEKTENYFIALRKLRDADRKIFQLHTIEPKNLDPERFFKEKTGLSPKENQVVFDTPCVRKAFLNPSPSNKSLKFKYAGDGELALLRKFYGSGCKATEERTIEYPIAKEDKVYTLMLGGNGSKSAIVDYINKIATALKTKPGQQYLFVFAGKFKKKDSLYSQVCETIQSLNLPQHFRVIPLSYQSDQEIAPLFARSNFTLTKTGGSTALELYATQPKKMLFHQASEKAGMVIWEEGNADFLGKIARTWLVSQTSIEDTLLALSSTA